MNQNRPEQAILSRNTDLSKTAETKAVIERMVDGLNDPRIKGGKVKGASTCWGIAGGLGEYQPGNENTFHV